ncbi:protein-glutamine gamma-glutamyltransferase K-like [Lytechinus pictus]|uniref:protein-glutamine gamma-glutamyltransferase K-like n=1 Tax=Lytechinus pictus TaxID=7653 RepID=UPI0030BA2566
METAAATHAGRNSGRFVNVTEAERAYLGDGRDKPEAPSRPDQLSLKELDFQLERNRSLHHTSDYEINNLFVRRGQRFDLTVTFNREPKTEVFGLELTVRGAKVSSAHNGTVIRMPFSRSEETLGEWGIRVVGTKGPEYQLVVSCPPNAIVSRYNVAVVILDTENAEPRYFKQKDPIFVLFNAWCREDTVFMEGDAQKDEYVLNDTGCVFTGTTRRQYARSWVFGQFEDITTDVVFDLLERWVEKAKSRADPVVVSRTFTHLINYFPTEEKASKVGLLVGNWSGDYDDGKSPSSWTGSTAIYEAYAKSNCEPVKYGQCWVFSGVLCTAMRCLGIPCRSVTNFSSAHDTDASMTIDVILDSETKETLDYMSDDSVWNFHVWNEAFFTRPDLPPLMGGWQAIDATPQESSKGFFQMGPAPIAAIRQGLTYMNYDTKFAFAEVNADRIYWLATKKDMGPPELKRLWCDTNAVGVRISTRKPGREIGNIREDVTAQYKFAAGSEEERSAVERAVSFGTRPNTYRPDRKEDDIEVEVLLAEDTPTGSDIELKVAVNNKSSVSRTVSFDVVAYMCFYTGLGKANMKSMKKEVTVPSGKSVQTLDVLGPDLYCRYLVDQPCIKFCVFGEVQETSQLIVCQDTVSLTPPEMKTEAKVDGYEVKIEAEFVNPLPITLTNCTIRIECPLIGRSMTLGQNDVPPKGVYKFGMSFPHQKKGKKHLVVDFDSKQMGNVIGDIFMEV